MDLRRLNGGTPIEGLEDVRQVGLADPDAPVGNADLNLASVRARCMTVGAGLNADPAFAAMRQDAVLQSVGDQILEALGEG